MFQTMMCTCHCVSDLKWALCSQLTKLALTYGTMYVLTYAFSSVNQDLTHGTIAEVQDFMRTWIIFTVRVSPYQSKPIWCIQRGTDQVHQVKILTISNSR